MFVKKIKFVDYNGVEREDTYYFNINQAELIELEAMTPGGLENYIKKITDEVDQPKILNLFKSIIRLAIGVKSEDGLRLRKNTEIADAFFESEAYSALIMELVSEPGKAQEFVSKVLPNIPEDHKTA